MSLSAVRQLLSEERVDSLAVFFCFTSPEALRLEGTVTGLVSVCGVEGGECVCVGGWWIWMRVCEYVYLSVGGWVGVSVGVGTCT